MKSINNLIINQVNNLEFYFIPICFLFGSFGNIIGAMCIFGTQRMRKRTPLFILATIGITDTILLTSQMQRWLAIYYDQEFYLVNHSLCKFYLLLVRSSVLTTSSLILALTIASVVRLYLGAFKLSTTSKLGQILSRLCVSYIIALSMSFSWHELWTSGLTNSTKAIHIPDDEHNDFTSTISTTLTTTTFTSTTTNSNVINKLILNYDIKCSKNVDSFLIINIINYFYFVLCILINMCLIMNSALIYLKLKEKLLILSKLLEKTDNLKSSCDKNLDSVYNSDALNTVNQITIYVDNLYSNNMIVKENLSEINVNKKKMKSDYSALSFNNLNTITNYENSSNNNNNMSIPNSIYDLKKEDSQIDRLDIKRADSSSTNNLNKLTRSPSNCETHQQTNKPTKNNPNNFTRYLIMISLMSTAFCFPFILFDLIFYNEVIVNLSISNEININEKLKTVNVTLSQTDSNSTQFNPLIDSIKRIPLILINIPHMIKFYLLFLFHDKFRNELSNFLRLKFYYDPKILTNNLNILNRLKHNHQSVSSHHTSCSSLKQNNKINQDQDNMQLNGESIINASKSLKLKSRKKKKKEIKKLNFQFNSNCIPWRVRNEPSYSTPDTSTNLFKPIKTKRKSKSKKASSPSHCIAYINKSTSFISTGQASRNKFSRDFFSKIDSDKRSSKMITILDNGEDDASSIVGYKL